MEEEVIYILLSSTTRAFDIPNPTPAYHDEIYCKKRKRREIKFWFDKIK
jgi:hypothetical protein